MCVYSFKGSLIKEHQIQDLHKKCLQFGETILAAGGFFHCWRYLQVAHLSSGNALSRCSSVIWADLAHGSLPRVELGEAEHLQDILGMTFKKLQLSWLSQEPGKHLEHILFMSAISVSATSGDKGSNPNKFN